MISHTVIFWTKPGAPEAITKLIQGAKERLTLLPGVKSIHAGAMVNTGTLASDSTFQVGLHMLFETRQSLENYLVHPPLLEFMEQVVLPNTQRVQIFDFEG